MITTKLKACLLVFAVLLAGCSEQAAEDVGKTVQLIDVKNAECAKIVQATWMADSMGLGVRYDVLLSDGSIVRWQRIDVAPCEVR